MIYKVVMTVPKTVGAGAYGVCVRKTPEIQTRCLPRRKEFCIAYIPSGNQRGFLFNKPTREAWRRLMTTPFGRTDENNIRR